MSLSAYFGFHLLMAVALMSPDTAGASYDTADPAFRDRLSVYVGCGTSPRERTKLDSSSDAAADFRTEYGSQLTPLLVGVLADVEGGNYQALKVATFFFESATDANADLGSIGWLPEYVYDNAWDYAAEIHADALSDSEIPFDEVEPMLDDMHVRVRRLAVRIARTLENVELLQTIAGTDTDVRARVDAAIALQQLGDGEFVITLCANELEEFTEVVCSG
jgi:hypothetical protein